MSTAALLPLSLKELFLAAASPQRRPQSRALNLAQALPTSGPFPAPELRLLHGPCLWALIMLDWEEGERDEDGTETNT